MLATAQQLNLAVRFAVELALLAAITTAAWHVPSAPALRYVAALGAVLAVSTGWVVVVHNDGVANWIDCSQRQRTGRNSHDHRADHDPYRSDG